jgi:hypothetical protein
MKREVTRADTVSNVDATTTADDAAASTHGSADWLPIQQPLCANGTAAHRHASYAFSAAAARGCASAGPTPADIYTACRAAQTRTSAQG